MSPGTVVQWVQALAWPLVGLVAVLLAAFTWRGHLLTSWVRDRLSKVEILGIKIELTAQAARETRQSADEAFSVLDRRLRREFDRSCERYSIRESVEAVIRAALPTLEQQNGGQPPENLRATVHVEDGLFADFLYQLIDYYPGGGGRGRAFSQRYGIIGIAWRSKLPSATGEVPVGPESRLALIRNWGMTDEEAAAAGSGRPAFLALPIIRQNVEVAVLYLDSTTANAFGDDDANLVKRQAICEALLHQVEVVGLIESLHHVQQEVRSVSPRLRRLLF